MRSEWEALHWGLVRSIATKEAELRFDALKRRVGVIARFERARTLVDYLAHAGGDLDEKDRIFVELALETRAGTPAARLAMALALLGLWPGLDAVFTHRAPFCRDHTGELAAEIVARFTDQVRRLDPARVHRAAATLVRSTRRDVVRARMRELRRRRRASGLPIEAAEELVASVCQPEEVPSAASKAADLCPVIVGSVDEEVAALRSWLLGLVGRDANLVVDAVLLNRPRQELGAERGIDERAARKRLQRALGRVRRCLEAQISGSRDGGEVAFARP
jgi:RNA polymerase sigma-70 factor (ECF subfamily)